MMLYYYHTTITIKITTENSAIKINIARLIIDLLYTFYLLLTNLKIFFYFFTYAFNIFRIDRLRP